MFLKISVFSDPRRILEEVIQTRFQEMGLSIARRSIIFEKDLRLGVRPASLDWFKRNPLFQIENS